MYIDPVKNTDHFLIASNPIKRVKDFGVRYDQSPQTCSQTQKGGTQEWKTDIVRKKGETLPWVVKQILLLNLTDASFAAGNTNLRDTRV